MLNMAQIEEAINSGNAAALLDHLSDSNPQLAAEVSRISRSKAKNNNQERFEKFREVVSSPDVANVVDMFAADYATMFEDTLDGEETVRIDIAILVSKDSFSKCLKAKKSTILKPVVLDNSNSPVDEDHFKTFARRTYKKKNTVSE